MKSELGTLVLMGSGETTPTMTSTHRRLVEQLGQAHCVMLDTPFGFQENADQIVDKTAEYFRLSVGQELHLASLRSSQASTLEIETALARLREANFIFAGPGSPTYTLRQWRDSPIPGMLLEKLRQGAVVVLASAAACTAGSHTVPVYEIYKVGEAPYWHPGLGMLQELGLPFVVLPHYNNGEGTGHDTRFCYMGEKRLALLEAQLPKEALLLGLDEHTACLFDLARRQATVTGRGAITVRSQGRSRVYPAGSTVGFDELCGHEFAEVVETEPDQPEEVAPPSAFTDQVDHLERAFADAMAARRADRAVAAALDLEQLMVDWASDTDMSGQRERARALLRSMLVQLGEGAMEGLRDPAQRIAPFVDCLLSVREQARQGRQWSLADQVRDALVAAGVVVHDTRSGPNWEFDGAPTRRRSEVF